MNAKHEILTYVGSIVFGQFIDSLNIDELDGTYKHIVERCKTDSDFKYGIMAIYIAGFIGAIDNHDLINDVMYEYEGKQKE